jgi:hypothetical protein
LAVGYLDASFQAEIELFAAVGVGEAEVDLGAIVAEEANAGFLDEVFSLEIAAGAVEDVVGSALDPVSDVRGLQGAVDVGFGDFGFDTSVEGFADE